MNRNGHVLDLLHDYVREKVDPAVRREIAKHLEECAPCREELGKTRAYFRRISKADTVAPPADFVECTMTRIEKESPFRRLTYLYSHRRVKVPAALAGLAAASLIAAFFLRPLFTPVRQAAGPAEQSMREQPSVAVLRTQHPARVNAGKTAIPGSRAVTIIDTEILPAAESGRPMEKSADEYRGGEIIVIALSVNRSAVTDDREETDQTAVALRSRERRDDSAAGSGGLSFSEKSSAVEMDRIAGVEDIVAGLSGTITRSTRRQGGTFYTIELPRGKYADLLRELGKLGSMKTSPGSPEKEGGRERVRMELDMNR